MKHLHSIVIITLLALLTGCGGVKTTDTVFPTSTDVCAEQASQTRFIVRWEDGSTTVEKGSSADNFRSTFVSDNLHMIRHVDQDQQIQLRQQVEANGVGDTDETLNWGPESIDAPAVWSKGFEGAGVVVGVVDGMVDTSHQQLSDNILVNAGEIPNNGLDDDHNGYVDDYKGVQINTETNDPVSNRHGSHVTGIIAADPTKGPVAGVAPKAKVVPAQFISNNGGGSIGDAIVALNYVANRGAKIINMSWGMDPCIDIPNLRSTLKDLNNRGILLITAAGNGDERGVGINMDITPSFPSAYNFSNQINVAASTTNQILAGFSNYGTNSVHVAAPGVGIYSTTPQNQIETMSGTSMAAPMVSGAAALLMSAIPTATAAQVKQALMSAVTRPPTPLNVKSGGVINVYDALTALKTITGVVIP
ncbi:MAG: S8 family serine peptidase [Bdellovibrionaceae bacterium]|nr:S8 family serine peptidase [Pseudobdellovibrionaceae bacterium]